MCKSRQQVLEKVAVGRFYHGFLGVRGCVFFRFDVKYNSAKAYACVTSKRETSENEAIILEFSATKQQKEGRI